MKKVLVVDDEDSILKVVEYALTEAGFEVHTAKDGEAAEFLLPQVQPDLLVLDVMLPGKSGLEIAKELRARGDNVPIIMLSARGDEIDRVLGLEFGADDYVTKPFSPRELVSRVKAILRRTEHSTEKSCIEIGDLQIDTLAREVSFAGQVIHLTSSEYGILLFLARHPGTAYSRQAILSALWDESPVGDERAIDVHIHNMREKIEADHRNPEYLLTVRGYGYRLREA